MALNTRSHRACVRSFWISSRASLRSAR